MLVTFFFAALFAALTLISKSKHGDVAILIIGSCAFLGILVKAPAFLRDLGKMMKVIVSSHRRR